MKNLESKRVLVVDDDLDICANIKDILEDVGFQTDTAHDGPSALSLVREHPYDVALLDYKMQGMNGVELCREIHRLRPEVSAIMITAHTGSSAVEQARAAGTRLVLQKPVDVASLLPMIRGCDLPAR